MQPSEPKPQPAPKPYSELRATLRVVVPYLVFASAWILLSDRLVLALAPDVRSAVFYGIAKGLMFVLVSGSLLFLLVSKEHRMRQRVEQDRARLLEQEQEARARAESANRAKDEMLAVVSHELRTPLTAILASAELLKSDEKLCVEHGELLDSIRENVLQESRIVADLLDSSSLAAGKLELSLTKVDMHELLRNVVRDLQHHVDGKNILLKTELAAGVATCDVDRTRLSQAVRNLLTNAAKFTPDGGTIQILTSNAVGRLVIEVHDTGIGIQPEVQQRLFRPFEQGNRSITRQFGGLGLGLYLSRAIVELHSGTIAVRSDGEGKGSTFQIDLPLSREPQISSAPPQDRAGGNGLAVLLVEDNIDTLRALARILGKMGCCVTAARSATEASDVAARQPVDLLISDIGLPDRSGWDLMRELRAKYSFPGIAFTGFSSEEDRRQSLAAGYQEHLVKPITYATLEAAVNSVANQRTPTR